MKTILFLFLSTWIVANTPDADLLAYQQKYTLCEGTNNYQITKCLLNSQINYNRFRGDRYPYKKINKVEFKKAEANGDIYEFVMERMPKTKRYIGLLAYLDYLYSIEAHFITPQFVGDSDEDIRRIKRIFNLLLDAQLIEDEVYTERFETSVLEYQRRHGLTADGDIGPQTR